MVNKGTYIMAESFNVPTDFTTGLFVIRRELIQDLIRTLNNFYLDHKAATESGKDIG